MPGRSRLAALSACLLALSFGLTACGVTRGDDSRDLKMMIPNSPGGGYDQTGRAAVDVMEDLDITGGTFQVSNIIGAGGSAAMTELMGKEGDEHTMMTAGLGVVGSLYSFGNEYKLHDATPLAQLITEPEGILVPGDSPFETVDDFVQAWQDDPSDLVVGVGHLPAGPTTCSPCSSPRPSTSTRTPSTTWPTTVAAR